MHTAKQVIRSHHRSTDLPPPSGPWHRLLGRRTLALIGAAFLLRLVATSLSVAGSRLAAPANGTAVVFCLGMLIVLAVNIVRARRELVPTWWGAYRARGEDEGASWASPPAADNDEDNIIDLSVWRRGRRPIRASREATGEVSPWGRRRAGVAVGVALLVVALAGATVWQLVDGFSPGPAGTTPAVAAPTGAVTTGASAAAATSPGASRSARPSPAASRAAAAPAATAPAATLVPSVDPPSAGPAGDGTYLIGVDLEAGTWKAGAVLTVPLGQCVYSVNAGAPKSPVLTVGAVTVKLAAGDSFTTAGCPLWRLT